MSFKLAESVKKTGSNKIDDVKKALQEALDNILITKSEFMDPVGENRNRIQSKFVNAQSVRIDELFEALIGPIKTICRDSHNFQRYQELVESANLKRKLGLKLEEAEVNSLAFQLLTSAVLFTTMEARYALTPSVHELLFGTFDSDFQSYRHQIPSDAPVVKNIPEGGVYPSYGITDRWCQTRAHKFGARVDLTREALMTDQTGQVVELAMGLSESCKYSEDQLAVYCVADTSNAAVIDASVDTADAGGYYPEGTNVPLYRTTAGTTKPAYEAVINSFAAGTNYLSYWDAIAKAIQYLRGMTNIKGQLIEAVGSGPLKLIVPYQLEQRAKMLASPTAGMEIRANAAAGTAYSIMHVPEYVKNMGAQSLEVIVWNKLPTNSTTFGQATWYLGGDTKKMFRKHIRWRPQFDKADAAQMGGEDFRRDIIGSYRAGMNVGMNAVDDKYMIKSIGN